MTDPTLPADLRTWLSGPGKGWEATEPGSLVVRALAVLYAFDVDDSRRCGLCTLGFPPFYAEGVWWHRVNGRDPFRCSRLEVPK